jgi:hypothetical protein
MNTSPTSKGDLAPGRVQVMVCADRVDIRRNPGSLPPTLSLAQLRHPHGSVPANPPAPQASTPVTKEETKEQTTEETGGEPAPTPDTPPVQRHPGPGNVSWP